MWLLPCLLSPTHKHTHAFGLKNSMARREKREKKFFNFDEWFWESESVFVLVCNISRQKKNSFVRVSSYSHAHQQMWKRERRHFLPFFPFKTTTTVRGCERRRDFGTPKQNIWAKVRRNTWLSLTEREREKYVRERARERKRKALGKPQNSLSQHYFPIIILFAFASLRLAFFPFRVWCIEKKRKKERKNFAFLSELFNNLFCNQKLISVQNKTWEWKKFVSTLARSPSNFGRCVRFFISITFAVWALCLSVSETIITSSKLNNVMCVILCCEALCGDKTAAREWW